MQLKLISEQREVELAFEKFRAAIIQSGVLHPETHIGWNGGHVVESVYWFDREKFWCLPLRNPPKNPEKKHHWICFGIGDLNVKPQHSITLEINPPHEGPRKGPSGAFLTDAHGKLYICHSGKIGGGRKGLTRAAFMEFCSAKTKVHVAERGQDMYFFGPVDDRDWIAELGAYVHKVADFKNKFKR